jgi:hypothetical protein
MRKYRRISQNMQKYNALFPLKIHRLSSPQSFEPILAESGHVRNTVNLPPVFFLFQTRNKPFFHNPNIQLPKMQ